MTVRLRRVVLLASGITLVLLALLPFTAPFSTLGLGVLLGEEPVGAGSLPEGTAVTAVAVPPDGFLPVLAPALVAPPLPWAAVPAQRSGTFVIPLRL